MSDPLQIKCAPNGPYLLNGPVDLVDPEGNVQHIAEGKKAALCRCGASVNKPFCDGTHSKVGFRAAEAAVKK